MSQPWESLLSLQIRRGYGLFARLDVEDVLFRYREHVAQGKRPMLSAPLLNHLCSFGPVGQAVVDPPSSDEESDVETSAPSLRTAVDSILDSKLCETSDSPLPVSYHKPALILLNIKGGLTPSKVKAGLKDLCDCIHKVQLVSFPLESRLCRSSILYLDSEQTAHRLYTALKREENEGSLDHRSVADKESFQKVSVKYFRYTALDPAVTWTAVVLRDVDRRTSSDDIRSLMQSKGLRPVRIEPPRPVNAGFCALVIFHDMESTEQFCRLYHKKLTLGGIWKAHIHPQSHVCPQKPPSTSFDYTDLYQLMQSSKTSIASAASEDPLKRLIRKRPNSN